MLVCVCVCEQEGEGRDGFVKCCMRWAGSSSAHEVIWEQTVSTLRENDVFDFCSRPTHTQTRAHTQGNDEVGRLGGADSDIQVSF